jgi:hypothetical protein
MGPMAATDEALPRSAPGAVTAAGAALALVVLVEAVADVLGGGGAFFDDWVHDFALAAAAALCLARGFSRARMHAAWMWLGAGLAAWAAGSIAWSVLYAGDADPPYPSIADALWLAWYPLTAVGIALLIRTRVPRFELHRWMDGLAVMLIVLTLGAGLFLQPVADDTHRSVAATVVDFSYPILDMLVIGAILGVYGLLGWKPGRAWLLLGAGCMVMGLADATFAVQEARSSLVDDDYDFVWTAGALAVALAAWTPAGPPAHHQDVYGWRAIALPVAAQLLAGGIQVLGLFVELGPSERVVTLAVLAIATAQIVITRPVRPGTG